MTVLRAPRLTLRRARMEDLGDIHAVLSDLCAMRYWSSPPHTDIAQTREWLGKMIDVLPEESEDFVIEYEGRVVGKAGCWRLPDIGYILHPDVWRRGLASEALSTIVPHIFAAHPIAALSADVDPRNTASLALLAKLGFSETHRAANTWRVGEAWCDSVYLTLPRPA